MPPAEGTDAVGSGFPNTVCVRAAQGEFDCVLSMYHNQGHVPIKMLGFSSGEAVSGLNVTIGLLIVRTTVDHRTAFDTTGTGIAPERSLLDALGVAVDMAQARTAAQLCSTITNNAFGGIQPYSSDSLRHADAVFLFSPRPRIGRDGRRTSYHWALSCLSDCRSPTDPCSSERAVPCHNNKSTDVTFTGTTSKIPVTPRWETCAARSF